MKARYLILKGLNCMFGETNWMFSASSHFKLKLKMTKSSIKVCCRLDQNDVNAISDSLLFILHSSSVFFCNFMMLLKLQIK